MNTLTLKAQRKKAKVEKQQQHVRDFYARAYKGLAIAPDTPQSKLIALERYLSNLESLHQEYSRKWEGKPDMYQNSLYWVEREIDMATMEIVRTRIRILQGLEI